MKKLITILFGVLLVLGMSVPAMATVLVWGTVSLDKDINVDENVTINKIITINADIEDLLVKAAEGNATINQDNLFNWACENCAEKLASITESVINNTGVINVNQATGNMNNQGNVVSVAVDVFPPDQPPPPPPGEEPPPPNRDPGGLAHAQTAVNQNMAFNQIVTFDLLFRNALIADSINDNTGIVGVNQSAGNINNQLNDVTIAVCLDGVVSLADADLGQINTDLGLDESLEQSVFEFNTNKNASVSGSINRNTGIVGVNQTVGNMANQANIANVAASIR
jgi:hypothetical protein